jgi:hypothetical protein
LLFLTKRLNPIKYAITFKSNRICLVTKKFAKLKKCYRLTANYEWRSLFYIKTYIDYYFLFYLFKQFINHFYLKNSKHQLYKNKKLFKKVPKSLFSTIIYLDASLIWNKLTNLLGLFENIPSYSYRKQFFIFR